MTSLLPGLSSGRLQRWFDYPRFQSTQCRVLLFEPHYYLAQELRQALTDLGHVVRCVPVPRDLAASGTWLQQWLSAAAQLRPDFLLSINHFGFDRSGAVAELLEHLRLPSAVWYVDDPEPILAGTAKLQARAFSSVFTLERSAVPRLAKLGFAHVEYLPLAVEPRRLAQAGQVRWPLVFVGDSWTHKRRDLGCNLSESARRGAEPAIAALASDGRTSRVSLLQHAPAGMEPAAQAPWLGYVQAAASRLWRQRVLEALPQQQLHVFGDSAWQQLLPAARCHAPVDYHQQVGAVYGCASVVVNVTSRQMPSALNQRLFDVPAAGGFVLTDAQSDLRDLLPEIPDMAIYQSPLEAHDKAVWWLGKSELRREITVKLRQRLEAEHLYSHRMQQMIGKMRARYG